MKNYLELAAKVLRQGEVRQTRSGECISLFGEPLEYDLREGFPAVTTKKLMWKAVVGELLWFLSGSSFLEDLKIYTELQEDAWTIWTEDSKRWKESLNILDEEGNVGRLYGSQWREWYEGNTASHVDQIQNLISSIKNDPTSRRLLVVNYNVGEVEQEMMALPPCHLMFQCYVSEGKYLDLKFNMRSSDVFLGLPFNISSYGLLQSILAKLTGLEPRYLKVDLGDVHVYSSHKEAMYQQLCRVPNQAPKLILPEFNTLTQVLEKTASDFVLEGYEHHEKIKAKLEVG